MSRNRKKKDYLPFMDFEERTKRDFGNVTKDARLHMMEKYLRKYMNPLSGVKIKGYDVAVEYTFSKGKVETNKSEKVFANFEEKLLDMLSPIMDYCEAVKVEVNRK